MPMSDTDLKLTTYQRWQKEEGIPVYKGDHISSVSNVELAAWPRIGGSGKGCFINLTEQEEDDARVMEIAPGGNLEPERHLFEELIYVVSGQGATTIWLPGKSKQTVEWNAGSVFSPPLNSWHQHFNASGSNPVRLLAVTSAPIVINLFHNDEFIFNNDFIFSDRYDAQNDFFSNQGYSLGGRIWKTNFIPDVRTFRLIEYKERGAGSTHVTFAIAGNSMCAHISEFPVGTYKKAHRHGPGAHIVIVEGQGYSLLWEEGHPRRRIDWQVGSMLVPGNQVFHQHFNTGSTPARYLALRWNSPEFPIDGKWKIVYSDTSGAQIEYEDEDPEIRATFEAELAKTGAPVTLPRVEYRNRRAEA